MWQHGWRPSNGGNVGQIRHVRQGNNNGGRPRPGAGLKVHEGRASRQQWWQKVIGDMAKGSQQLHKDNNKE